MFFNKRKQSNSEKTPDLLKLFGEHTFATLLSGQIVSTARFGLRVVASAHHAQTLFAAIPDLVTMAQSAYKNSPECATDPDAERYFTKIYNLPDDDFLEPKNITDCMNYFGTIENTARTQDYALTASYITRLSLHLNHISGSLSGIAWALLEINRNPWGAQDELWETTRSPYMEQTVFNEKLADWERALLGFHLIEEELRLSQFYMNLCQASISAINYYIESGEPV